MINETGPEGMARRDKRRLSERASRYRADGGARGAGEFVMFFKSC